MYFSKSRATTENLLKWGIFDTLKEKIKWGNLKCSVKTTEGTKRIKDKNRNKEQGQQIENTNEYDKYYHFEC